MGFSCLRYLHQFVSTLQIYVLFFFCKEFPKKINVIYNIFRINVLLAGLLWIF